MQTMETDKEEQLRIQLTGCSMVALGATRNPAKKGDYGWSPAYRDVRKLRLKFDRCMKLAKKEEEKK